MTGASVLLLVGLFGPLESEEDLSRQVAVPPKSAPAANLPPPAARKGGRRVRAIQSRAKTNDITETLRAMNLTQITAAPASAQGSGRNH